MLIIAIPKSASTSLLDTLGRLHHLPAEQQIHKTQPIPAGFRFLHRYHSDFREYTEELIASWLAPDVFFKQHIPPTENNCSLLEHQKRVVLLRNPEEVVAAYRRAHNRQLDGQVRSEFAGDRSIEDWMRRAKETGLLDDLHSFHSGWTRASGPSCFVDYQELVSHPAETMNRIEDFFGLSRSSRVVLSKKRYTGS